MAKPSPSHAKDVYLVKIGTAIRRTRKEKGISQETLAADAGLDRSYMGGIERGDHNFSAINLKKIAEALEVQPSALLLDAGY